MIEPLIGGISGIDFLKPEGKYRPIPKKGQVYNGQMSWFGQFKGKYNWVDKADNGLNASGLPQTTPGIAYMARKTLKHWFKLTFPNGKTVIVRQIDIGPSIWTNKMIDVNAALSELVGYSPKNFPTGSTIIFQYIGEDTPDGATK